jgi:transcriptional regulator with XRE-family HTH domain
MRHVDQSGHRDGQTTILGSFLKDKRECAGLSLRALSLRTSVSRPELLRIERGISTAPSPRLLKLIATKGELGITAIDLYAAAGYLSADDLPDFRAYLAAKHPDWQDDAFRELECFYEFICDKQSCK